MLENVSISLIWYILIVGGSLLFLILFGLYLAGYYHFGKPLAPFMNIRIKRWSDPRAALFEIITLLGNVYLTPAQEETGGYRMPSVVRTVREPFTTKQKLFWGILTVSVIIAIFGLLKFLGVGTLKAAGISFIGFALPVLAISRQATHTELIGDNRPQPLIMPLSIYTVNGVPTIPLLDLHPPLHRDLKSGLQILISRNISNPDELKTWIDSGHGQDELLAGYTCESFYDLYNSTRQKYEFKVTVSDINEAMNKTYDKNFSESIQAKEFNAKTKAKTDNNHMKIGYAALLIVVIGVTIKLIYFTFYGGAPTP